MKSVILKICLIVVQIFRRCLRPALSAHTAQALATGPVSATIANARKTLSLRGAGESCAAGDVASRGWISNLRNYTILH